MSSVIPVVSTGYNILPFNLASPPVKSLRYNCQRHFYYKLPDILLLGFEIGKNAINWWILSTYCIMSFFNGVKTISKRIAKTGLK